MVRTSHTYLVEINSNVLIMIKRPILALNYNDDRDVMVVVAYNKNEEARQRWTRKGSRSVRRIEYRELDGSRQISFVDQDDCHVLFPLTELKVSYTR